MTTNRIKMCYSSLSLTALRHLVSLFVAPRVTKAEAKTHLEDAARWFEGAAKSLEQLKEMRPREPYASQLPQLDRVAKANLIACRLASAGRFLTDTVGRLRTCRVPICI